MTTYGDLISNFRLEIKDLGPTFKWSDDLMFLFAKDAFRDYSKYFPLRVEREELTQDISDATRYNLPTALKEILFVESPRDTFLEPRETKQGVKYNTTRRPLSYYTDQGNLVISREPTESVYLTYTAIHGLPADSSDTSFVLTIDDDDEEMIRSYLIWKANRQLAGRQARLDRFKVGTGKRNDNPMYPELDALFLDYLRQVNLKLGGKSHNLHRPGSIK